MNQIHALVKNGVVINIVVCSEDYAQVMIEKQLCEYAIRCDGVEFDRPMIGHLYNSETNKFIDPNNEDRYVIIENNTLVDKGEPIEESELE